MADHDQEQKPVQRAATATAPTAESPEGAMHETRMNVTRQRRAAMRKGSGAGAAPEVDIPEGGGKTLDGPVKKSMEKKLGADLSGVNIHTGGASASASEKLNARAFTVGNDVHFNAGQFDPASKEGTKLLAHELTHVVQGQKGGVQKKEEPEEKDAGADAEGKDGEALEVSDPEEPAEQEADAVAEEATADMGEGGAAADGATAETSDAGGEAKAESEGEAAETEEKAPEAGAKIKAPISAKLSASALRKLLRKKAFRDEAPAEAEAEAEEKPAEAEAAPAEGETAEAKPPEAEASTSENETKESEETEKPSQSVAAKLKGVHRKIFRAAPAVDPAKQAIIDKAKACRTEADVDAFCAPDRIASQKLADVKAEDNLENNGSAAAKAGFYDALANWIRSNAETVNQTTIFNQCMNNLSTPWKFKGTKIDISKIGRAMQRTQGLSGFWWNAVNQQTYMDMFDGQPNQANLAQAKWKEDAKDPRKLNASIDKGKKISPQNGTWFTPDSYKLSNAADAGFNQLLELAALQPEWFPEGNIAFEVDVATAGAFEARKPTAYDGMQSSLWVSRPGPETFGVTGGGAQEFLGKEVATSAITNAVAVIPSADTLDQLRTAVQTARDLALQQDPELKARIDAAPAGSQAKKDLEAMIPNLTDMFLRGNAPSPLGTMVKKMLGDIKTATEGERRDPSANRAAGDVQAPSTR